MDRFWVFLEALAGFLENDKSVEALKQDLSQMSNSDRERMANYLRVAREKLPLLAPDRAQHTPTSST
jgi:hypothetical protein